GGGGRAPKKGTGAVAPARLEARALGPGAATANPPAAQSVPAAPAPAPSPVAQHAARLRSEGRLAVSHEQVLEMSSPPSLGARTEETLFSFSVRELASPEPAARKRAAERLKALGNPAAAPAGGAAVAARS